MGMVSTFNWCGISIKLMKKPLSLAVPSYYCQFHVTVALAVTKNISSSADISGPLPYSRQDGRRLPIHPGRTITALPCANASSIPLFFFFHNEPRLSFRASRDLSRRVELLHIAPPSGCCLYQKVELLYFS